MTSRGRRRDPALGGMEAEPAELLATVEELARGDGSTAWCVIIGATSGTLSAYLPKNEARPIYGDPRVITGGVFAPRGRAQRRGEGYVVSGRWPFVSGVQHCSTTLQRRFRDVHVAAQHMMVAPATYELSGRLPLGAPTDTGQLWSTFCRALTRDEPRDDGPPRLASNDRPPTCRRDAALAWLSALDRRPSLSTLLPWPPRTRASRARHPRGTGLC